MEEKKPMEVCTKTSDNYSLRENEFIKDDMIYCSKCGEPKLYEFPNYEQDKNKGIMKFPKRVRVICSCEQKEIERQEKLKQQQQQIEKFKKLQETSLIGSRYYNVNFENTDLSVGNSFKNAYNRCKKYCENYKECLANGYGIYLYAGRCGAAPL